MSARSSERRSPGSRGGVAHPFRAALVACACLLWTVDAVHGQNVRRDGGGMAFQRALVEAQEKAERLEAETASLRAENESLRTEAEALRAQLDSARSRLAETEALLARVQRQNEAYRERSEQFRERSVESLETARRWYGEYADTIRALKRAAMENEAMQAQLSDLRAEGSLCRGRNEQLVELAREMLSDQGETTCEELRQHGGPVLLGTDLVKRENAIQDYRRRIEEQAIGTGTGAAGADSEAPNP